MRIGILGGGLAGLSLGYFLKKKGLDFMILEKNPETGGLLKSVTVNGFTFDVGGSHIIFSKDEEILTFMVSLLGDNVLRRRRNTKILYKGHYVKYPFENGLSDLPREDTFECLYYFVGNLIQKEKGELKSPQNMKEWFYYTFGKGIAEKYLVPYNEKIWKFPLEKMSTLWVERIPQPPVEDIIKSALGIPTEGYTHQLYFYYPKHGGIQSLARAFEREVAGNIMTNFKVERIKREDNKWVVSDGNREFKFDRIISTIPLPALLEALDAPEHVMKASKGLYYNSLITVGIGVKREKLNDFSWLYIPDKKILTHRVSFPSNYSPHVAPNGSSSVLAEITYREGDAISRMNDEEIAQRTLSDLVDLGVIPEDSEVLLTYKFKYAYVVYDVDFRRKLDEVFNYLNDTGVYSVGRFGSWEYANMDRVIKMSREFVNEFFSSHM